MTKNMNPEFIALSVIILLFSVILHEVMHGLVALKFGDRTAERAGRLTLNPLPHIDPIGTILLPAIVLIPSLLSGTPPGPLLAWAKPVPVNPLNFSNLRKGELFVSLAGVLSNYGLAILAAIFYHILAPINAVPFFILEVLQFAALINLFLGTFNLLPVPPLDGSKVLMALLPYNLAREYAKLDRYGFLILLFIVFVFPDPLFGLLRFLVGNMAALLGF